MLQWWTVALASGAAVLGQSGAPRTPDQTLASMRVAAGFRVELVAAEPSVQDPVAMTWDEHGRLFVVEMSDYPAETTGGRIRRLRDRDNDGRIDEAVVFADRLPFPTSALPYKGGLLVSAAPNILFLKDTDGDGRADERQTIFTGFGEGNQQLRVNGLVWGLDNWVYGANGRSNGAVRSAANPVGPAVSIQNHDFRFRPDGSALEPVAGFSQFGQGFDDWGNRFVSWNTVHIRHVVLTARQSQRNPLAAIGTAAAHIADHGDAARVFPLTAPQPRYNREPPGYFNASCGLTIERGGVFAPPFAGSAFVCEPLFNLIHRDELKPAGPTFIASRGAGEQEAEFLAATDPWFHPVNLVSGPDGALYVADFYREWVEHPQFVPDELEKGIEFRRGHGLGRIWRIRPKDQPLLPIVDLGRLTAAELVLELSHPNAWRRTTAQRLLLERHDAGVVAILEKLAGRGENALGRLHALWTLEGLGQLKERHVLAALRDDSAYLRTNAVRLSERFAPPPPALVEALLAAAHDRAPQVRCAVAGRLGELPIGRTVRALAEIARQDAADPWTRAALGSSVGESPTLFLDELRRAFSAPLSKEQMLLVEQAAAMAGFTAAAADRQWLTAHVQRAAATAPDDWLLAVLVGAFDGAARRGGASGNPTGVVEASRPLALPQRWLTWAEEQARASAAPMYRREYALRLFAVESSDRAATTLGEFLTPAAAPELQRAALAGLRRQRTLAAAERLLAAWPQAAGTLRGEIQSALFTSRDRVDRLLTAVEEGRVAAEQIELHWREHLLQADDGKLRERARKLLARTDGLDRQSVVKRYEPALSLPADTQRGAAVFGKHCAACHRFRGSGADVGPDLSGIVVKPKGQVLVDLFDPNREIVPNYTSFVVATKDGAIRTGLLAAESTTAITLRQAEGIEAAILRDEIETLRTAGRSLMPEGFEQSLSVQEVADLLAFLRQ